MARLISTLRKAGEAHCPATGSVFGIDQGQLVDAPLARKAAPAFAPVEIVAIQFPVVAFRIAPVLTQDLRPLGQQIGETRLQRPSCRDGDEAPAMAFDGMGGRERGVRLADREPAHVAGLQRDLEMLTAVMAGRGMDGSMVEGFTVSRRR